MRLKPRLDALEAKLPLASPRWVRVFQQVGQTREAALVAYEAEQGPIDGANVILRVLVKPRFPVPHAAG